MQLRSTAVRGIRTLCGVNGTSTRAVAAFSMASKSCGAAYVSVIVVILRRTVLVPGLELEQR